MDAPDDDEIESKMEEAMREGTGTIPSRALEDVPKAQLLLTKRLIVEMEELQDSLDSHRKTSKHLTWASIALTIALLGLAFVQVVLALLRFVL